MSFILGLIFGLIIGWNVFPQPKCVAEFFANLKEKLKAK